MFVMGKETGVSVLVRSEKVLSAKRPTIMVAGGVVVVSTSLLETRDPREIGSKDNHWVNPYSPCRNILSFLGLATSRPTG